MMNLSRYRTLPAVLACLLTGLVGFPIGHTQEKLSDSSVTEASLLTNTRLLTFEGRRAGEGYFNSDGTKMIFQSERDPANPFYQIYVTDLETGDLEKISPGYGKTTCGWIHPDGETALFASTHQDAEARSKQTEELELRATGKQRRYSWDYDPNYELYAADLDQVKAGTDAGLTRLTDAEGYDAEASYSPDGSQIVFASNREAYSRELTEREAESFQRDPAFMIDLYLMNADGSNVRRLTDEPGYDGGPFFSPDGQRICWRRFSPDGATAEIFTMNVDGSDVKRLTSLKAMSWAPYYHPSGDYLIFTTNKHGFANFELYLVRADGKGQPVRVTTTPGFDGLPVFLPNGEQLSWTSTRRLDGAGKLVMEDGKPKKGTSQIYLADFNDAEARKLLGLSGDDTTEDSRIGRESLQATAPEYRDRDVMRHVDYLTRPELGGRLTGTEGEKKATAYVAAYLESLGFEPAGSDGTFFHEFTFPAGSTLGPQNNFGIAISKEATIPAKLSTDWNPLSFSQTGKIAAGTVVFAGYGLQVPGDDEFDEYDSYVHLDVSDRWVMVFRDLPQDITAEQRQRMARYGSPRRKATIARDNGAKGIIFVAGPTSQVSRELVRFDADASQAQVSIAAVSISNELATKIMKAKGEDLGKLQKGLDDGSLAMGIQVEDVTISANIDVNRRTGQGRNVIARLPAGEAGATAGYPAVMVGAHIDHLGRGGSNSLAGEDEQGKIHVGADDNASGVAAMLEIAQSIASEKRSGKLKMKRDLMVAAWSGEELGLFGSQAFVDEFHKLYPDAPVDLVDDDVAMAQAHGMTPNAASLGKALAVYLNLDMVGRLKEKLIIQGIGSSPGFEGEVGRRNVPVGLPIQLDRTSTRLPTDASAFVARGVPILSAFTGAHEDYHTPRDTPDKLNYPAAAKIARLFGLLTRGFLTASEPPLFKLDEGQSTKEVPRARLTAYLGTIPDYAAGEIKGLKLSGVGADGPASKAGLQGGDVIVELAGRKVEDIYDYTYAIEALKIGQQVKIVIERAGKPMTLDITPGSRD